MSDKRERTVIELSRLQQLMNQKGSRSEIAKDLCCDVSTITKHFNGDRAVTAEYLLKYAKYFGVSADYLLGLSDVPSIDTDIKGVCEFTGLDSNVVYLLHLMKKYDSDSLAFMNYWLSDLDTICNMSDNASQAYENYIQKSESTVDNLTKDYSELKSKHPTLSDENYDDYFQVGFDIKEGIKKIENMQNYFDYLIHTESIKFAKELNNFLFEDSRSAELLESLDNLEKYFDDIKSTLASEGMSISPITQFEAVKQWQRLKKEGTHTV